MFFDQVIEVRAPWLLFSIYLRSFHIFHIHWQNAKNHTICQALLNFRMSDDTKSVIAGRLLERAELGTFKRAPGPRHSSTGFKWESPTLLTPQPLIWEVSLQYLRLVQVRKKLGYGRSKTIFGGRCRRMYSFSNSGCPRATNWVTTHCNCARRW